MDPLVFHMKILIGFLIIINKTLNLIHNKYWFKKILLLISKRLTSLFLIISTKMQVINE